MFTDADWAVFAAYRGNVVAVFRAPCERGIGVPQVDRLLEW
ncbi:MAG: hypothetical protein WBL53_18035 [Pseudonocardiaceae bacterium]